MRFFHRIIGSISKGSRVRDRRRSPFTCEALEGRALLSNIPGVSLQFGNLGIIAPKASGNVAEVSVDPANHNIKVSLNGQSEEFSASQVHSMTYVGGKQGGDTFVNDTSLGELAVGFGGHNAFTGGIGDYNTIYFVGNDNTYNAQDGSSSLVLETGTNTINAPADATVVHDTPSPGLTKLFS